MALLMQEGSEPALQLDSHLFMVPATYTDFIRTETERILPTSGVTEEMSSGDMTFYIPPSSSFLSLPDISLEFEAAIKKKEENGSWVHLAAADQVAPVNYFAHAIWSQVQVTLANRLISDASPTYGYRSYIEAILNSSRAAIESQLTSSLLYLDEPDKFDTADNKGEVARKALFTTHGYVPMSGRPHCDLFQQSKNLLPGVPLQIRFVLNRAQFYFRGTAEGAPDCKLFIRNPRLHIKRMIPNPSYLAAVTHQLASTTAKYHVERVLIRSFDIPSSTMGTTIANVHIGALPKVMFIGFVNTASFHGAKKNNPFYFQHFDINQLSVEAEGISFPTKPYQLVPNKGSALEPYDGLLEVLQKKNSNWGELPFDREAWMKGYAFFGVDLTPGSTGRGQMSLVKQGNLSIRVQFGTALTATVMCVVYMVFDNIIGKSVANTSARSSPLTLLCFRDQPAPAADC